MTIATSEVMSLRSIKISILLLLLRHYATTQKLHCVFIMQGSNDVTVIRITGVTSGHQICELHIAGLTPSHRHCYLATLGTVFTSL